MERDKRKEQEVDENGMVVSTNVERRVASIGGGKEGDSEGGRKQVGSETWGVAVIGGGKE